MTFSKQNSEFCFYILQAKLLLVSGLFLIFVYPHLRIDEWLISFFYDSNAQQFTLKHNWFLEGFMHQGLKILMIGIAILTLLFWGLSYNNTYLDNYRAPLGKTFIGMVCATAIVSIVKQQSIHSCPWDLSMYGGSQPFLELFQSAPKNTTYGKCFPGGHASGGFSLWAFYFFFRDFRPDMAKYGLYTGSIFGIVMGWSQMMRGAHFMSHNLWSAWLIWSVLLFLHFILNRTQFKREHN